MPREQRRLLRKPRAAREARERKAELPWERARAEFREVVASGALPAGCIRVVDALAEGHAELGKKAQQEGVYSPVYKAFGNRGDAYRTRVAAPTTDLPALAEACGMSRRWVIVCIARMAAASVAGFKKVPGGMHPDGDPRNLREKDARATKGGVRRRVEMAVGGAGWANGYLVEGIADPPTTPSEPPEPEPPPAAEPDPEAPSGPRPAGWWKSSLGPDPRPHARGRGP